MHRKTSCQRQVTKMIKKEEKTQWSSCISRQERVHDKISYTYIYTPITQVSVLFAYILQTIDKTNNQLGAQWIPMMLMLLSPPLAMLHLLHLLHRQGKR